MYWKTSGYSQHISCFVLPSQVETFCCRVCVNRQQPCNADWTAQQRRLGQALKAALPAPLASASAGRLPRKPCWQTATWCLSAETIQGTACMPASDKHAQGSRDTHPVTYMFQRLFRYFKHCLAVSSIAVFSLQLKGVSWLTGQASML